MALQIAREIYLKQLDTMKKVLDLVEYGMDMRTNKFKFAKSQIMNYTYENLRKLFKTMEDNKIVEKCECGANLRKGYTSCKYCGGSGFKNIITK